MGGNRRSGNASPREVFQVRTTTGTDGACRPCQNYQVVRFLRLYLTLAVGRGACRLGDAVSSIALPSNLSIWRVGISEVAGADLKEADASL